jgi:hypothetical protein
MTLGHRISFHDAGNVVNYLRLSPSLFTLRMEAVRSSETLVSYITTLRHNPEDLDKNFYFVNSFHFLLFGPLSYILLLISRDGIAQRYSTGLRAG